MTFSLLLEEMLDGLKPVPYKKTGTKQHNEYIFTINNIRFILTSIYTEDENVDISFKGKKDINNISTTKILFATIIDIIKKIVSEQNPKTITINPISDSRFRLYRDLAKSFADKMGYDVKTIEGNKSMGILGYIILNKKGLK